MRLLSLRLIVSLIVGITLVSSGFSYYEVLGEKRALRSDLERRAELFGESLAGNVERAWNAESNKAGLGKPAPERTPIRFPATNCNNLCSVSETVSICWASPFTTVRASR